MSDTDLHEGETAFESFVEKELAGLAARALEEKICLDCLGGRLVVELIAGLTRSGCEPQTVLEMVIEGLDGGVEEESHGSEGRSRRMH